ncbi:Filamentation induced by cAMP protein [Sodalis praecaptivus]|uniref:protein adenylyltransferase n=1 Tax=Sodalis praecaptivus TaxID=1239307 RepID=W0HNS8_9GAMM|nr:putative adenosine monophosphate-protein transferase Fic [Sodalis praecaptivus]AHF75501.1 Filamentation induced by cAMP protein [Sodalis praecaptivus]
MNDKIGDDRDPYFYPGLKVLRNVLNIHEAAGLQEAELALTALRAASLTLGPANMGLPWLCAIHHTLFQDIYPWAGQLRSVDIYQNDVRFCHFAYLETEGNAVMQRLEEEDYLRDLPFEPFCDQLAVFYADINMLHPFREGNGRAQRIFFEQLIIHAGYDIRWHPLDRQDWLRANEAGAFGDPAPLAALFKRAVSEPGDDV